MKFIHFQSHAAKKYIKKKIQHFNNSKIYTGGLNIFWELNLILLSLFWVFVECILKIIIFY